MSTDIQPAGTGLPIYMRRSYRSCDRPNCRRDGVITLAWGGMMLTFCAQHAEGKAGGGNARLVWLAVDWDICAACWRVLPATLAAGEHFDLLGEPCVFIAGPRPQSAV